ncbi:tetratricopeptide repeat protein [Peptococcaceae bacterium CEB3]|nr:tetratricopeptide repeat protein [Peptococcaceae bacterium CEB3]
MKSAPLDPEVFYVQKLYYFFFLITLSFMTGVICGWRFGWKAGVLAFLVGLVLSYLAMLFKKSFALPDRKIVAKRMAKEISQAASPLVIARFASQLYYYLKEKDRAIALLEQFLPSCDPLVCATLAEIYLREGKSRKALSVLHDNPYALANPLLLATQAHILRQNGKTAEAVKLYERSLRLAKGAGFPHNGAHRLTQALLTISYTASIHHALADCFLELKDTTAAEKHYRAGNRLLVDISLWRSSKPRLSRLSAKSFTKSS